jgi:perosamine synthetase
LNEKENKVNEWKIPLYKIFTDDEDVNLITKVIKRGTEWAIGPEIEEFENSIKNYVGVDYCLTLNSGTSALHATFLAYDFKKNDQIIVPSFSFISTANAVRFVGATPIFADIEEKTLGLDPKEVENKITNTTRSIVPMDYGGQSCDIIKLKQVAENYKIPLIEDAAEGLGSTIEGKKVGSQSDSAIFSFCGNKVLTTGEGGAIVTNSKEIFEKVKLIRSHGRVDNISYFNNPSDATYLQLGYNWRMSSITAALGITQIAKLDKIIKMRQLNANYISQRLKKISSIKTPKISEEFNHIFQMYTIRLPSQKIRDDLHTHLLEKKIFSKVYFNPIHLTASFKENFDTREGMLPITEKISKIILTLPLYPNMTNEEKEYLIESIIEFFENQI